MELDFSNPHRVVSVSLDEAYSADAPVKPVAVHPLDAAPMQDRLNKLKQWRFEARTAHGWNREQQAIDADFYDGLQWSEDDIQALTERHQAPLVFNLTKKYVDWLVGTERRTKVDWRVFPREDDDREAAEVKTKLLKYVADSNKAAYHRSLAFQEACKVGIGWLEDGIRSDPTEEPLYSRCESWRYVWYDPLAREPDLSDARYIFREKWVDLDVAKAMFPDRHAVLERAAVTANLMANEEDADLAFSAWRTDQGNSHTWAYGASVLEDSFHIAVRRQRVRLVEMWYRQPERVKVLRANPYLEGEDRRRVDPFIGVADPTDATVSELVSEGIASLYDAVKMRLRVGVFCDDGYLQDLASPYRHDRFPFTPVWGYRRDRDNAPYGVVRNLRDAQEDLNKRRSKALFLLSTNQVIADEDAVEDWDELAEQVARPNGIIRKKRGAELEVRRDIELAEEHVALMQQDMEFMESSSGVTEENLGEETNAQSGRAILARQTQGGVVTAALFDNLRFAIQLQGEKQLALIEQFYDEPKSIRLTNSRGTAEFTRINAPLVDPITGMMETKNAITASKADFNVDAQDFRESMRLAMAEQLLEMLSAMPPEVSLNLLDLVVELLDVPGKEEIVRRIRAANGQIDPDAPDAAEQQARKDASDAEQAALQKAAVEAEVAQLQGQAEQADAAATNARADALTKSLTLVGQLLTAPQIAPAVDTMYQSLQDAPAGAPAPGMTPGAGSAAGTIQSIAAAGTPLGAGSAITPPGTRTGQGQAPGMTTPQGAASSGLPGMTPPAGTADLPPPPAGTTSGARTAPPSSTI